MDNLEISEMTLLDLETIQDILISDFDDFWSVSTLKGELQNSNSKYIVAKLDNDIVGFGGIWKAVDDIHITDIVVRKAQRNNGIGSAILAKLIEISKSDKNIKALTLEVNSNNTSAQKLYEKFDFKKVGLRKKYYNNTDDAIIMTKQLN
jgi:[ribosomal protein S18]-alanine N-acetyltransferase